MLGYVDRPKAPFLPSKVDAPNKVELVDELLIATRTNAASVFEVSDAYQACLQGDDGTERAAIEDEIGRLTAFGFLLPPGDIRRNEQVPSLVLHLVHGCNLACAYCCVERGTFGEKFQLMPFETARLAIDRLTPIGVRSIVCLFGGEPLLNWPVLVQIVEYGRTLADRRIDWKLTTNGTLLDSRRARALARLQVEVTVSIDGDRDDHNRNRVTRGGLGSYDATVQGISALLDANARAGLHSTHDGTGASYRDRYDHLMMLGKGRLPVVVAPETGSGTYHHGFGSEGMQWGARLRAQWRGGDRNVPAYIGGTVNLVAQGERAARQDCPAGSRMVNVTPAGDVFACHVAAARKMYRLGNLSDPLWSNPNPLGQAPIPKACAGCWANGLCSHGCPIRRFGGFEPSIDECETYREPIRCAAYFLHLAELEDLTNLWVLDEAARRSLGRAWAVRELLRDRHRHVRPLAIFPASTH